MTHSENDRGTDGPRSEQARPGQGRRAAPFRRAPASDAPGTAAAGAGTTGPWPDEPRDTPLILDTDIGGDPDDAIAVAAAARTVPELALVLTNDETGDGPPHGERARLARHLLDLLGRGDVATVAGHSTGGTRYFCAHGLVPAKVPAQPSDATGAVRDLLERTPGKVRWVGMGALSNLARVLDEVPEAAGRLVLTQMGGGLAYRDPSRAEHNIRMDVPAAHRVFDAIARGRPTARLVTSDVTFRPEIEIVPAGAVHRRLTEAPDGGWRGLLRRHLEAWFAAFHPGSMQHDALALSAALGEGFVGFGPERIALDRIGRTVRAGRADRGAKVQLSTAAEYGPFNTWLEGALFGRADTHRG